MLLLGPVAAHATITTYSTRYLFNSAVGIPTLIDFEAQQLDTEAGLTSYGGNLTVGDVNFTDSDELLYVFNNKGFNDPFFIGNTSNFLLNFGGEAPVVITFTGSPVYSVGMDLGWLLKDFGDGSQMTITLNTTDSFATDVAGPLVSTTTPFSFVGFSSDTPFSSMTIFDPSQTVMIDNFAYSSSAPTPEPATMLLLGTGLAALAGARKLKKQQQPA